VAELDMRVFLFASELREEYSLSFWDSLIVSAAFLSGAEIIYSEDMQAGLVIRENLKIVNPLK
jgi:predicted nucleic acid-binding protein